MYVCICKGITDSDIKAAVDNGDDTLRALNRKFGVGSQCGKCTAMAREVIREHTAGRQTESADVGYFIPEPERHVA